MTNKELISKIREEILHLKMKELQRTNGINTGADVYLSSYAVLSILSNALTAESEDERIRKWLVDYFSSIKETVWIHRDITCGQILAWLEKQKELTATMNGEPIPTENHSVDVPLAGWSDIRKVDNPMKWMEEDEKEREQKPVTWSEEDEKILNELLDHCNTENATWYDWLNSIRPPFKDREMKLKILKYLSTRCSSLEFEEVEDYLNNLRPSWKPSEEQMDALQHAIDACESEWDYQDDELRSLLNDIKKL